MLFRSGQSNVSKKVTKRELLESLPKTKLKKLADKGKEKKEGIDAEEICAIRKRHGVE
mgnify:CR=1 FL=1